MKISRLKIVKFGVWVYLSAMIFALMKIGAETKFLSLFFGFSVWMWVGQLMYSEFHRPLSTVRAYLRTILVVASGSAIGATILKFVTKI